MKKIMISLMALACFAGGGKPVPITSGAGEPGSFVPKAGGNEGFPSSYTNTSLFQTPSLLNITYTNQSHGGFITWEGEMSQTNKVRIHNQVNDVTVSIEGTPGAIIQWTTNFFELWKEPTGVVFMTYPAIVEWIHAGTMNRCAVVIYNGQTNILKGELLETLTNTFEIMDKPYNPRIFTAPAINLIFTNSNP